jgi:polyhydroxyalkanoate synthesis repressor PhaR
MSQPPKRIVIRKYENRRLYDATNSRYVNLEDLSQMVRAGDDVQVLDAKTNEDITRTVLTQIIMEDSKGRQPGLPVELLRQLILAGDTARHQFLEWYLKSAMEAYQKVSTGMEERWREMQPLPGAGLPSTGPLDALFQLWRSNPFLPTGAAGSVPFLPWMTPMQPAAEPAPAIDPKQQEIDDLRRRLEDLEKLLRTGRKKKADE